MATWLKGDADGLASLLLAGMREYPDLYEKVLVERNRRWVGEIEKIDPRVINHLEAGGFIPVIAPVGVGEHGDVARLRAPPLVGSQHVRRVPPVMVAVGERAGNGVPARPRQNSRVEGSSRPRRAA